MTQPPGAQPPPGYPGNPWQTPPGEPPTGPTYPPPAPAYPPPGPPPGSAPPYPGSAPPAYPGSAPPAYPGSAPPAYPGSAPPAYPGSAPPAYPGGPPVEQPPTSGFPQPGYAPPYPGSAPPYPGSAPPTGYPPYFGPPQAPPRRRGLLITAIVLAVVVVLGGGGVAAFLLFNRNSDGVGKSSPTAAAESFLQAVYVNQDPAKAAPLVCAAARDKKKITTKINQVKDQDRQYESPKYTWTPLKTESSASDHAVVSTTVTMLTANVQKATQKLRLTVIKSNGWFVCDVQQT